MSFFNSIRGFGRSSKKTTKKDLEAPTTLYSHSNNSGSTLGSANNTNFNGSARRSSQSPTKISPSKQSRINNTQVNFGSPTKRSKIGQASPKRQFQASSQQLQQLQQAQIRKLQSSNKDEPLPLFLSEPFVKTQLVKGSYKTIVQLPKYVDSGEWIALNIFEFYHHLNMFYGVVTDYCTPENCPSMNAGSSTNYLWMDNTGQAVNLPAQQYIDYVLSWTLSKLNDKSVFPVKSGGVFPANFLKDCKNISRQMFRIFAHIYHNHFETLVHLSLEAHWNSFFGHFISFVKEFNLFDRTEMEPLLPLIDDFQNQGKII